MIPSAFAPLTAMDEEQAVEVQRVSEEQLESRLIEVRQAAILETEHRLRQEYEHRSKIESGKIVHALEEFQQTRKEYFANVEAEVVQLALAIAGKILHREAQVDPLLVAALVQIALDQLNEGAAASLRVRPEEGQRWRDRFAGQSRVKVAIVEDAKLEVGDCIMDTHLGSVNFSLDVQLKEVERGFFDVLAQRPPL
jgi:flagellar assembly protein FliH